MPNSEHRKVEYDFTSLSRHILAAIAVVLLTFIGAANANDAAVYSDNAVKNTPCTLFHNR